MITPRSPSSFGSLSAIREAAESDRVESPDQIHLDRLREQPQVEWSIALADRPRRAADSGAIDQNAYAAKCFARAVDRGCHLLLAGHIGFDEDRAAADLGSDFGPARAGQVGNRDRCTALGERACGGFTEPRTTAGNDGAYPVDFHPR